jgi:hypothetical protein
MSYREFARRLNERNRRRLPPLRSAHQPRHHVSESERIHALLDEGLTRFGGSRSWHDTMAQAEAATDQAYRERHDIRPAPEPEAEEPEVIERRHLRSRADHDRAEATLRVYQALERQRLREAR